MSYMSSRYLTRPKKTGSYGSTLYGNQRASVEYFGKKEIDPGPEVSPQIILVNQTGGA